LIQYPEVTHHSFLTLSRHGFTKGLVVTDSFIEG